jgi:hypothetical protein
MYNVALMTAELSEDERENSMARRLLSKSLCHVTFEKPQGNDKIKGFAVTLFQQKKHVYMYTGLCELFLPALINSIV